MSQVERGTKISQYIGNSVMSLKLVGACLEIRLPVTNHNTAKGCIGVGPGYACDYVSSAMHPDSPNHVLSLQLFQIHSRQTDRTATYRLVLGRRCSAATFVPTSTCRCCHFVESVSAHRARARRSVEMAAFAPRGQLRVSSHSPSSSLILKGKARAST